MKNLTKIANVDLSSVAKSASPKQAIRLQLILIEYYRTETNKTNLVNNEEMKSAMRNG